MVCVGMCIIGLAHPATVEVGMIAALAGGYAGFRMSR